MTKNAKPLNFYDPNHYAKLIERLTNLKADSNARWGEMTVDQMIHHLNLAIGSGLGYYDLLDRSNFFSRKIAKWVIFVLLKRFPKGSKTPDTLEVQESYDFQEELNRLLEILEKAYHTKKDEDWKLHTYFGPLSRDEWGLLIMIHVDHHLRQFGT